MKASVYLSNRAVAAVCGGPGRQDGGLKIKDCHRRELPWGLVYNGTVADRAPLAEQLGAFWRESGLPRRGVSLVVDSDAVTGRVLHVPALRPGPLRQLIRNELTLGQNGDGYLYDYTVLPAGEGEGDRIYALAAERGLVAGFVDLFAAMGVRLAGIDLAPLCAMRIFGAAEAYRGRTFIYTRLEGPDILSMLFADGAFAFIDRGQLMEARGTPAAAVEISRAIQAMAQYQYASITQSPLSHVYISGLMGEETQFCGDMSDALGLLAGPLSPAGLPQGLPGGDCGDYLFCLGDLLC